MKLSNQQLQIVNSEERVIMVVAGPGSGKTQVLTQRVIHFLSKRAPEHSMLLFTFTNKAAKNMQDRIEKQLERAPAIMGGTFHHIANIFIRMNAHKLGIAQNYSIIDEADSIRLLKKVLKEEYQKESELLPNAAQLQKMFSYCRNSLSTFSDYLELHLKSHREDTLLISGVYNSYTQRKRVGNMLDFDDLLELFNKLLDDAEFRAQMQERFRYIFVDEFQDTCKLQFEIIRKLYKEGNHLFVVGDDCQSIYSFRAAEIMNMLGFRAVFPSVKMFYLTENYRSTPKIVSLINDIISRNKNKFDKKLDSVQQEDVPLIPEVIIYDDAKSEAQSVAEEIKELIDAGTKPEEIAVLYRSNFQSANLERELFRKGIKYIKLGGLKFFEQAHIKDVTALLKILCGMIDELAWERMLKMFEGIGDKTASKIFNEIRSAPNPLTALKEMNEKKLRTLSKIIALAENKDTPTEKAEVFLKEYYDAYMKEEYEDYEFRREDINQLLSILSDYNTINEFLEDTMLDANLTDPKDVAGRITISTVHQAKGLEWDNVFVIGLAKEIFPSKHSMENELKVEEERRLFYVACSRARSLLKITVPLRDNTGWNGEKDLEISPFINELPKDKYILNWVKKPKKPAISKDNYEWNTDFVSADTLL